jgi:hypothetical protein
MSGERIPRASRVLVAAALFVACALGVLHLLGARDAVSILSGTVPSGGAGSAALGAFYALAWFATVVLAPPMVIAAVLLAAARYARAPCRPPRSPP